MFRSADSYLDEPAVVSSFVYFMFSNIYLKNHEAKFLEKIKKKKEEAAKKKEAGGNEKHMFFFTWPNIYAKIYCSTFKPGFHLLNKYTRNSREHINVTDVIL